MREGCSLSPHQNRACHGHGIDILSSCLSQLSHMEEGKGREGKEGLILLFKASANIQQHCDQEEEEEEEEADKKRTFSRASSSIFSKPRVSERERERERESGDRAS